jgi:hypothetical protein
MRYYSNIKVRLVNLDMATHALAVFYSLRCDYPESDNVINTESYHDYMNWANPDDFTPATAKRLTEAVKDMFDGKDNTQYLRYAN